MKKKRRIGILGGTFNPPHLGHLALAQESLERLKLDKIVFIPTYIPPHKKVHKDNAKMRYKMVALACKGNPKFEVSTIELRKKTVSYSVDTLRRLRNQYGKNTQLFFIMGSDSLGELDSWKDVDELLKLANFVVMNRPGVRIKRLKKNVKLIIGPALDISSSMIRNRVRRSQSIRYYVPDSVRDFIMENKFYK